MEVDGGDGRHVVAGERGVVDGQHGHVVGGAQAQLAQRPQRADGLDVARGQERRELEPALERRQHGGVRVLLRHVRRPDERLVVREPPFAEPLAVALQAVEAEGEAARPVEERDPLVALLRQVLNAQAPDLDVVVVDVVDGVDVGPVAQRPPEEDDRDLRLLQRGQVGRVDGRVREDQPVGAAAPQERPDLLRGLLLRLDDVEREVVAPLQGRAVHPLEQAPEEARRREEVLQRHGDEQGQGAGAPVGQALGHGVRVVVQLTGRLEDPLAGLGAHQRLAVEGQRGRGDGDPRAPRDVPDGRGHAPASRPGSRSNRFDPEL